jgi:hypothetical protein
LPASLAAEEEAGGRGEQGEARRFGDQGGVVVAVEILNTNGTINTNATPVNVTADISTTLSNNNQTVTFAVIPGSALDRTGAGDHGIFTNGVYQLVLNGAYITDQATGTAELANGGAAPVTFANAVPGDGGSSSCFGVLFGDLAGSGQVTIADARAFTVDYTQDIENTTLDYYETGALTIADARQFSKVYGAIYSY